MPIDAGGGHAEVTAMPVDGVHRLAIPTPFAIGDVNAYLLEGDPLTLIDCGPNTGHALLALKHGLAELGYELSDLELVLITHQHGDHLGLAAVLVELSGAEIGCLAALAPYARDFDREVNRDDDLAAELMLTHGVHPVTVATLRSFTRVARGFGGSFETSASIEDGDAIDAGSLRLRAAHVPGHSPSDTLFIDEEHGFAFGGDHLLPDTSSNALISHPLAGTAGVSAADRPHALSIYLQSMEETLARGLDAVLPGHGDIVDAPAALIERRLQFHHDRSKRMLDILQARPHNAHEIATAIWGGVAISQAYLTTCEVLGHLDLLVAQELVVEDESSAVTTFAAVT
jgi:glyoxylase-like metal-dependent hydrolase (beta-lactamase superfamily II)